MGIAEIGVFFFIYVVTFIIVGLFASFLAWINDDSDFAPWFVSLLLNIGFSYALTYILSIKGII